MYKRWTRNYRKWEKSENRRLRCSIRWYNFVSGRRRTSNVHHFFLLLTSSVTLFYWFCKTNHMKFQDQMVVSWLSLLDVLNTSNVQDNITLVLLETQNPKGLKGLKKYLVAFLRWLRCMSWLVFRHRSRILIPA